MTKFTLSPQMGEAIVTRLRDFTDLPNEGYLAGQAVASAISELYGDGSAVVYNDIDVFRRRQAQEVGLLKNRALSTCQYYHEDFTYSQLWGHQPCHRVLRSTRNGMLNDVVCEFEMGLSAVLTRFDMNCVQVGLDLHSKQLYWTRAFEEFLRTRQIEIVSLVTPFHSLIRYFKKREELTGTYGNDERMRELVAAAYQLQHQDEAGLELGQWRVGAVSQEKLERVHAHLASDFEVGSEDIGGYTVATLKPRFTVDADLASAVPRKLARDWLPRVSRILREKHKPGVLERLKYVAGTLHPQNRAHLVTKLVTVGEHFFRDNVTPAQAAKLDATLKEHDILHVIQAPTLAQEWANLNLVLEQVKKRGLWVFGVLENRSRKINLHELGSCLDAEEVQLGEQLTEPLLPALTLQGYRCQELVSQLALMAEGHALHHCVGGYSYQVRQGTSRIWSIRPVSGEADPSTWLTMELQRRNGVWDLGQIRGLCNRDATKAEYRIAAKVITRATCAQAFGAKASLFIHQYQWGQWCAATLHTRLRQLAGLPGSLADTWGLPSALPTGRRKRRWVSASEWRYWLAVVPYQFKRLRQSPRKAKYATSQEIPF